MKKPFTFLLATLFVLGVVSTQAQTTIRYVQPSGAGDGSSWATASNNIGNMVTASAAGDQIWVAAGTYFPTTSLSMKEGVAIYGGFVGTETTLTERNWTVNATILNGSSNGNKTIISNNNNGLTNAAVLDGFTLTAANVTGIGGINAPSNNCRAAPGGNGGNAFGAMFNLGVSPTIRNCIFSGNRATGGKGGTGEDANGFCWNGGKGGKGGDGFAGMYNFNSSPTIHNCIFSGNTATGGAGGNGGDASSSAGGIGGNGFAIMYNFNNSVIASNCIFSGNTATGGKGGVSTGNAVSGGTSSGITNNNSSLTISNCIFSNNSGTGGVSGPGSFFYLSPYYGSIRNVASTVVINNSILWATVLPVLSDSVGSVTEVRYSTVKGSYNNLDPLFVNESNAIGADGLWRTADDGLRLQPCSPSLNLGSNALVPTGIPMDIAGADRIQHATVDMGAYESTYEGTGSNSSTTHLAICSSQLPYPYLGHTMTAVGSDTLHITKTNGCDSLAILILTIQAAPTGASLQNYCSGTATLANLTVGGTNLTWYTAASVGTVLANTTPLVHGTTYYATQTNLITGCESIDRFAVTAIYNNPAAQTVTATDSIFNVVGATTIHLGSSETGVHYYLQNNANDTIVAGPVAGTGSSISFATGSITTTTTYKVSVKRINKALDFNGTNYVTVGNIPALKPTSNLTLEAWVYVRNASLIQCIISGGRDRVAYNLVIQNGQFHFWGQSYSGVSSTAGACQVGNWYHIALTYQVDVGSKMYINGVLNNSNSNNATPLVYDSYPVTIGMLASGDFYRFIGKIDEVRIWNTTRTAAEIQTNKDNCLQGNELGLKLYYNFEEGSDTTLFDKTTNGNSGTLTSATPATDWVTGATQACSDCSSTMANLATVRILPLAPIGTATQSFCGGATVADLTATGIGLKWYAAASGDTVLSSTTVLVNGTHYYASQTVRDNESATRLDVTAIGVINNQTLTAVQSNLSCGTTTIHLGSSERGVQYYLRNNATNTVVSGPVLGTGSGIALHTGAIATTTTYHAFAQKNNKALDFNGSTNYVSIGDVAVLKPTANLTLEAWVYVRDMASIQCILSGGVDGTAYNLVIQDGYFKFWGGGYGGVSSSSTYPPNTWYHVALTYQAGTGMARCSKMYINGVLNNSDTSYTAPLAYVPAAPVRIGLLASTNYYPFNGKIDEVRIWNTTRTPNEIGADKDNCLTGNESGLVLYYDFQEGAGTTLTNKATIGSNGTLTNMIPATAWVTGVDGCSTCPSTMANLATVTIHSVLPLELLRFTGKNTVEGNVLIWETANEVNTKGFNIERSMEQGQWFILGFLPTKGAAAWYDFTDPNPFSVSYYRLRQIDNGGKETFSKIISLSNSTKASLKVYPNPATDVLTVAFADSMLETAPIFEVRNVLGQLMLSGTLQRSIDIATLPSGTYILRVGLDQVKFVKE
jgi:Concanavalin A-like lectin/glucanases superfamily/Secretion system C-terminal sorting domain